MKPNPTQSAVPCRHFAAALLLSVLPAAGQTIPNPSFEANTFTVSPGYISGNGAITGWTADVPTRAGLNPAGSSPFANNGTIPAGVNVAFIQAGSGASKLTTTLTDLVVGTKYKVTMRLNARNGNLPSLVFASDGTGPPVGVGVAAVGGTNPYRTGAFEFTATATSQTLTLTNDRTAGGDHTVLVDDLKIVPSDDAWSFAPWTGDTDSGIDSQYLYTHAFSFGSNTPVTVNGVKFNGASAGAPGPFTVTGLTSAYGNGGPNLTGDSLNLGKDFRYAGSLGITLNNLKPATEYVFTAYGFGWDGPGVYRSATFSSSVPGSQALSVNLNQYGLKNGILVNYRYTTDAVGTPVTISYPSADANTYHTAGFSNREAAAGVQPVRWTAEPWNDDATSGVSPNHVYTFAYNFNSTKDVNVNGVKFTGVAGANPTATGVSTSGLAGLYANDTNTVTGYGAALAKDFVYGGNPEIYNVDGLVPGRDYVLTFYSVGFDADRPLSLTGAPGEQPTILNQDAFGDNQGVRLEYRYTAAASGLATIYVSGFNGSSTLHCYAISNREADPMTGVAPVITLQPAETLIGVGHPLVLRVGATGSATLTYQWKYNGDDINGATSPILDLGDAKYSEAGTYSVVVSNGSGILPSDTVEVTVYDNVPGLFGTGVGVDGAPLTGVASGTVDTHYSLLVNPDNTSSQSAYVQTNLPGSWLRNSTTSQWIGPRANTAAAAAMTTDAGEGFGNYVYRTTVDLTGFTLSTVQITGAWASDNSGMTIRVNGADLAGSAHDVGVTFGALQSFTIDSNNASLNQGLNTIDFVVNNADVATGYTGLRVEGLAGVGEIPAGTAPHIAVQPVGGDAAHYAQFPLVVGASGSSVLTYQWYKDGVLISGETEALFGVSIDAPDAAGDYKVVVGNGTEPDAVSDTVSITIPNSIPVAVDDSLSTNKNTPLLINPQDGLFGNDTDADGDALELESFSTPSANGGTVTESSGILTYTPPSGYFGADSFTYTVKDGWGGVSASATVNITILDVSPPPGQLVLTVDLTGGTVSGTFTGSEGVSYILQRSTTLMSDWETIDTAVAPASGIVNVQDANPPAGKAFYRIAYPD